MARVAKPDWIYILRGEPRGDEHTWLRIDHVWVRHDGGDFRLNGSIVITCRNEHRMFRTVVGNSIRDGVRPMWLLERNGLGAMVRLNRARVRAVGA